MDIPGSEAVTLNSIALILDPRVIIASARKEFFICDLSFYNLYAKPLTCARCFSLESPFRLCS